MTAARVLFLIALLVASLAFARDATASASLTVPAITKHPPVDPLGASQGQVCGFGAGKWLLYDPAVPPELSDLKALVRGHGYWIKVRMAQTVALGAGTYQLSAGWNLIGWLGQTTDAPAAPAPPANASLTVPRNPLAPLGANLVRVWGFNGATQTFQLYDPAVPSEINDLTALTRGHGYWICVKTPQAVTLGTGTYELSAGWNLIGWLG